MEEDVHVVSTPTDLPGDLPPEIFARVLSFLGLKECVALESVNSRWRSLLLDRWRSLLSVRTPEFIRAFRGVECDRMFFGSLLKKVAPFALSVRFESSGDGSESISKILSDFCEENPPNLKFMSFKNLPTVKLGAVSNFNGLEGLLFSLAKEEQHNFVDFNLSMIVCYLNELKGFSLIDPHDRFTTHGTYIPLLSENLQYLELDVTQYGNELNDHLYGKGFPNLRTLKIKNKFWIWQITEYLRLDLRYFPNLLELDVSHVAALDNIEFLRHLQILRVYAGNHSIQAPVLQQVLETFTYFKKELRELRLPFLPSPPSEHLLKEVGTLSNLQWLRLANGGESVTPQAVASIVRGCRQLVHLDLSWSDLNDEGMAAIGKWAPNLQELNIEFCRQVTSWGMIDFLWNRPPGTSIVIVIRGTQVRMNDLRGVHDRCVNVLFKF